MSARYEVPSPSVVSRSTLRTTTPGTPGHDRARSCREIDRCARKVMTTPAMASRVPANSSKIGIVVSAYTSPVRRRPMQEGIKRPTSDEVSPRARPRLGQREQCVTWWPMSGRSAAAQAATEASDHLHQSQSLLPAFLRVLAGRRWAKHCIRPVTHSTLSRSKAIA